MDPIFKILLFEPETEEAAGSEFPDYAFFKDKVSRIEAHKNKGTISFYTNAIAIGEVKKWDLDIDGKPIHQLRNYLDVTGKKWGILTNGRKWRLFCKEEGRDDYYEVDLHSLLDSTNLEEFKYFFYFFRRDAFLTLPEVFLEQVLRGSEDHAKAIGNNLKDNVYKAMKKIADGFFGRTQNNLDRNNETARELVHKNTMLLLYRLLFLLHAEDRNLLDLKNPKYMTNHSFYRIKKEVEEKRGRSEQGYDNTGTFIWDGLKNLFGLINLGSEAFGEKEFHVPAYNGGLFDAIKNPELEIWKIGDKYLAEAIHLLTWSDINGSGFVDYSDLEIRHLGSIYEGLLEYKLKVAESDIVTKGNEWVILEKYNEEKKQKKAFEDFDEFSHARKGELYLATDKGERKATGSYYTPDYIVNYIVKNTVGPVVEEKWREAEGKKLNLIDATLSVKVLDPAMGSGHFLVGSVEFLADSLIDAAQKDIDAGRLSDESRFYDKGWARREVVAHCIYGVDLNPMAVELAKVGLWLTTISREKPLSFLDHRLKQGNSLIGARLENLHEYPDLKGKNVKRAAQQSAAQQRFEVEIERPFFERIIKILDTLTDINDDSIENIHKKKDIFEKLLASSEYQRIKAVANVYTAVYFGREPVSVKGRPKDGYYQIFWGLNKDEAEWRRRTINYQWFRMAQKLAEEKSFFHWELEFPEIFFEGGAPKENPGWDAVVGNPPYIRDRLQQEVTENNFFSIEFRSAYQKYDIYALFVEKGIYLLKSGGDLGFIIPNKFMAARYAIPLREILLKDTCMKHIVDVSQIGVFLNISVYPHI
ncbi:MAG: BREX-1 system adenine-specific DNA-methyltransferase PglX, partial [Candidatus Methanoperedens sp.]|nr:BREX-1 system adenine-specific DNA-methyltransferase PglX [Candidatus Methanoperedens sp.]